MLCQLEKQSKTPRIRKESAWKEHKAHVSSLFLNLGDRDTVMSRPVANFCDHHATNVYVAILAGNMKRGQARVVCFVPVPHIVDDQIANVQVTIVGCKCRRSITSPSARVLVIHVIHDELAKSEVAFEGCPVQRGVSVAFGGGLFFETCLWFFGGD